MAVLPIHIILSILFLQALRTSSTPEEAFLKYPLQGDEDDGYIYLDSRADPAYAPESAFKSGETRRRSILDKNFARFGRSGYNPMKNKPLNDQSPASGKNINMLYNMMDNEELDVDSFGRNARSGEKSDQFIRFGRGKSDFVRFGRAGRDFIRFGRSVNARQPKANKKHANVKNVSVKPPNAKITQRKKRSPEIDYFKKSSGSNFVRFGRADRNDNFMRFGRLQQQSDATNGNKLLAVKDNGNGTHIRKLLEELQGQQSHELLLKMLMDLLTRNHLQKELQQLQQIQQQQHENKNNNNKDLKVSNTC